MSPRPVEPVMGAKARIAAHLRNVVRIGVDTGRWKAKDVASVAREILPFAADPRLHEYAQRVREAERRAEQAARDNDDLRTYIGRLEAAIDLRTATAPETHVIVAMAPQRAAVLTEASKGKPRPVIAEEMGMTVHNVNNTLARAAADIGAASPRQAIALVQSGRVEVVAKGRAA